MSRVPDDGLENDTTPLGFGDAAPVKREAPPLRVDKYDGHPDHDDPPLAWDEVPDDEGTGAVVAGPAGAPRRKKKKKKKQRPDLLTRLEREPEPAWAKVPLLILGGGLALCLIPLIVLVIKASEAGAAAGLTAGATGGLLLFIGVLFQIALMASVMFGVGILFGIDYGPIGRAFVKLAAVIAMTDGVTGSLGLAFHAGCGGLGILMAVCLSVVVAYALIQGLFELTGFEAIVTVVGVMLASVTLSAVAGYVFLSKLAKAG